MRQNVDAHRCGVLRRDGHRSHGLRVVRRANPLLGVAALRDEEDPALSGGQASNARTAATPGRCTADSVDFLRFHFPYSGRESVAQLGNRRDRGKRQGHSDWLSGTPQPSTSRSSPLVELSSRVHARAGSPRLRRLHRSPVEVGEVVHSRPINSKFERVIPRRPTEYRTWLIEPAAGDESQYGWDCRRGAPEPPHQKHTALRYCHVAADTPPSALELGLATRKLRELSG